MFKKRKKEDLFTKEKIDKLLSGELSFANYSMKDIKKNKIANQVALVFWGIALVANGMMIFQKPFWMAMYLYYVPIYSKQLSRYKKSKKLVGKYQKYLETKQKNMENNKTFTIAQIPSYKVVNSRPLRVNYNPDLVKIVGTREHYKKLENNRRMVPVINNPTVKTLSLKHS